MVVLELEPDPSFQAERLDMGARQLQPARPVEHGVLGRDDVMLAGRGHGSMAEHLAAHPAVADGHRPVDLVADERVVGRHDDRDAELAVEAAEQVEDLVRGRGVELPGRLVGEQDLGAVGQGDRDRHALLLATGHPIRPVVGPIGQADLLEELAGQLPRGRGAGIPSRTIGRATFSSAVRYGSRFREVCCQTNPMTWRR